MNNNSKDRYLLGFDTSKDASILSNTAAITSTLTRVLSFIAGKNLRASYQEPHARSSAVKLEAKDMVSWKRDKSYKTYHMPVDNIFYSHQCENRTPYYVPLY